MRVLEVSAAFAALLLAVHGRRQLEPREISMDEFIAETSTGNTNVELNILTKDKAARNATAP
jgi:hypothetical protein